MGNSNEQIGKQLKFIQNIDDNNFGQIDIYRNEDGKFIMKVKRSFVVGDRRHIEFKKIVEWANNEKSNFIAPIVAINHTLQKSICIQYDIAEIFTEYYNYTLKNLITNKKELDEAQLWFVLQSLLHLTTILRKNKFGINLDINNVFITLKGTLCVYIHHLISFEQSIQCSQYGMGQLIAILLLQLSIGETISFQNYELSGKEFLVYISKSCNKYKKLGKIIKQLLNREKSQEETLFQIKNLEQNNKIKKSNEIKLNKFKYAIPQPNQIKIQSTNLQQKNINETKIIEFKPNKKGNNDTIKKSRNKIVTQINNSQIQNEDKFILNVFKDEIQNKQNEKIGKQMCSKILTDIQNKKRQNQLKKYQFQIRRQGLVSEIQKENKENFIVIQEPKAKQTSKSTKVHRVRRQTQGNHNNKKI